MGFLQGYAKKLGVTDYLGTWNASTNTPSIVSSVGDKGSYYIVSVAGTTNINGISDWGVGDWIIFNGTAWQKIDNSELVTTVAGKTGDITLVKADVGLGNVPNVDATSRANHTGTQLASTISDFTTAVQAVTIDASKIDGGVVSNAEFTTLDGITTGVSIQSQLNGKEPTITVGTAIQYWRGDKSFQTLNAAAVVNTPAGNIAATTVQAALNELDTEKQPIGNYITALTGDVTASGPGSVAATLSNTGVTAGTYTSVTVDAKGRVTAGTTTGSTSRYSYTVTTPSAVTGITYTTIGQLTTISLPIGVYKFNFLGQMQSATSTVGVGVRISGVSATVTTAFAQWRIKQTGDGINSVYEYDQLSTTTNAVSASVPTANTNFTVTGDGIFRVTVAGTVAIQTRAELAGTAVTVQPDSVLLVELV